MGISAERKYVLVSRKWTKSNLMFWGTKTDDANPRSYGGYSDDLRTCERYALEEVEGREFKKFDHANFFRRKYADETFYATVEELEENFYPAALTITI